MLEIQYIRENAQMVIEGLKKKRFLQAEEVVEKTILTDKERREIQNQQDQLLAEANSLSKKIGLLMREGKKEEAELVKKASIHAKQKAKEYADLLSQKEKGLEELLYQMPNVPHKNVPEGSSADDNEVIFQSTNFPKLPESALPHWELISKYDIINFELGNKVTGAGFPFYKGKGARLQRALVNFFLDEATKAGYQEIQPPVVVNEASALGTGQLPDKEGQMYKLENHDYYLIPTAEVPITNMFRNVILEKKQLPLKLTGFTPCFRREAGSWGADVRGLNRLHQFDKVEIVQITEPSISYEVHEEMKNHIENVVQKLALPYRILNLAGGDLSFNAALCYDFEVFSAAQKKWLEVSSISNFETFQANRLKLRYRNTENKSQLVHTLNGSALALPRIVAAILENNQTESGITIPEVLHDYTGFDIIK
ncbi:MAG: serine--tRNA ligase [Bacteroidota bacterium]